MLNRWQIKSQTLRLICSLNDLFLWIVLSMLRLLSLFSCFSFLLAGCYGAGSYTDKKEALRQCKEWQAAGRTVNVKILSFHSASEGYSFLVFSRDCIHDEDSSRVVGYVYPLVQSGDFENKYAQFPFRNFLDVSSAKGPSRFARNFSY